MPLVELIHHDAMAPDVQGRINIARMVASEIAHFENLSEQVSRYGIDPADTLAIGDGRNDIEMLRWAGRGVALGDAPWEVRAAADDVTANFEDGGTAAELNRWFAFGAVRQRELRSA